jgi:hypothetical protein
MKKPNSTKPITEITCQSRLNHIANTSLDVVESILMDVEAPITIRLEAAFKIFELCGLSQSRSGKLLNQAIDRNARDIEKNAHDLAFLKALLTAHDASLKAHDAKNPTSDQHLEKIEDFLKNYDASNIFSENSFNQDVNNGSSEKPLEKVD